MAYETPASGLQNANPTDGENVTGAAAEQIGIVTTTSASAAPAMGGVDEMATYLTTGSWGGVTQFFDTSQDNILTFNVTGLTAEGQQLARWALGAWEVVANLEFREITGSADITFDDNQAGAFANFSTINNRIVHADVNISTAWLGNSGTAFGSYSMFTYIHEIGHALGLGHMGAYDGGGTFASNAIFANDSYQMSVMSYFDQRENTTVNASYAVPILPMMVDIVAIQRFYGASSQTAGDTVWGANTTLTGFMATLSSNWQNGTIGTGLPIALTIFDQGGTDLLDLSFSGSGDRIDLRSMQFSNVGGLIGNVAIARGTVIENLRAGEGSDHITGNGASNLIFGRGGFDTIYGGEGYDTVDGGNGRDLVYLEDGNDLYVDNAQSGGWGKDTVFGGGGNDIIRGGGDDDVFHGQSGNDSISAGVGNDKAYGGDGYDTLRGDAGNDTVDGGNGRDLVYLDDGNDLYIDNAQTGGMGRDTVFGGGGNDVIQGGGDDDVFYGQSGSDSISSGLGNDKAYGGDGFDTLLGGGGNDMVDGGNGRDLVYLDDGNDLFVDNTQTGGWGRDTVFGGSGNDTIRGGGDDDVFHGQWGRDLIYGGSGNDLIYGGDEYDTIHGGGGNDTVDGGNGRDLVYLNEGNDLYIDNNQSGGMGMDTVYAGFGNDTIQGGGDNDVFHGQWGNDRILAGLGNDTVYGGDQFDFIDAGDGNDLVDGGNGRDTIFLGAGNDVYVDSAQAGIYGQDTITGGAGADRFEFQAGMSSDVIKDFQVGIDDLQLTQSLWGGGLSETQVVSTYASVIGAGVLFEFGAGQSILLEGLNSTSGLEGDLLLV